MREVKVNRVYRHFKGDYYIVRGICRHSETKEEMVIYQALYGDGELWVRPLKMWTEKVNKHKYPNVRQKYRFELKEIDSVNIG
ncbi:MAG: DUF1653 domain-containing protein [Candidatus Saccharibacteria bacterium]|nr:DUF1653 domain-containing protein [Candidatus Saccharibacteria bacterium]